MRKTAGFSLATPPMTAASSTARLTPIAAAIPMRAAMLITAATTLTARPMTAASSTARLTLIAAVILMTTALIPHGMAAVTTKKIGYPDTTPPTAVFNNALQNLSNGTLNNADLEGLGLNFTACGGLPLDDYMLEYLETVLDPNAGHADDWQNNIGALADCDEDGAEWIITNMITNSATYPPSYLTATVIDNLLELPGYTSIILGAAGLNINDLRDIFDDMTLAVPVLDSSVAAVLWQTLAGFDTASQAQAFYEHNDNANFPLAYFKDCYASPYYTTGGRDACLLTAAQWQATVTTKNAITSQDFTPLTPALLTTLISAEGDVMQPGVALTNPAHLNYIMLCVEALSIAQGPTDVSDCVTTATLQDIADHGG